jgi:hypothetical protein
MTQDAIGGKGMLVWLRRLVSRRTAGKRPGPVRKGDERVPESPVDPIDEPIWVVGEQETDPPRRAKVLTFPRRRQGR